jgi:hypothetical protein
LVSSAPDGGRLYANNWHRRVWQPAVAATGVIVTFHGLRHTSVGLRISSSWRSTMISVSLASLDRTHNNTSSIVRFDARYTKDRTTTLPDDYPHRSPDGHQRTPWSTAMSDFCNPRGSAKSGSSTGPALMVGVHAGPVGLTGVEQAAEQRVRGEPTRCLGGLRPFSRRGIFVVWPFVSVAFARTVALIRALR